MLSKYLACYCFTAIATCLLASSSLAYTGQGLASKAKIISLPGWDCEYIGQQPCRPLPGWHIEISDVYGNTISIPDIAKPPPRVGAETAVIMDRPSARSRRRAVEGVPNAASREFERCLLRPGFDYPCSTQRV